MSPNMPEEIKPHSNDYYLGSWAQYTLQELGNWVHLLHKRSLHRTNRDKQAQDVYSTLSGLEI